MGMTIRDFYTKAVQEDFSRDFQMRVYEIQSTVGGTVIGPDDNVYITTANLPGYAITNVPTPFMGLQFNVPGSATFPGSDAWAVTFRCDMRLNVRQKIVNWQASIFDAFPNDPNQSTGNYAPKESESTAKLVVHDRDMNGVRAVKLIGIYPVSIGEIAYDQTGTGTLVTLPVTFAYQWWEPDTTISLR